MFETEQCAQHVGIERSGIALSGLIDDEAGLTFGAGDVDGYVEAAEAGHGLVDQAADFIIVTYVGLDKDAFPPYPLEFNFEGLTLSGTAAGNNQTSADLGECHCGGATDAGQGTCDEDDGLVHDLIPTRYDWNVWVPLKASPSGFEVHCQERRSVG